MNTRLLFGLLWLTPTLCFGALSTDTSYFLNVEALTNVTARSAVRGLTGVFTNGITAGASTFSSIAVTNSGTTNQILFSSPNAAAANVQVGRLQVQDYGGGNTVNNVVLAAGSTGNPNIRLQVDSTSAHIGMNIGGTIASAFTTKNTGLGAYNEYRTLTYQSTGTGDQTTLGYTASAAAFDLVMPTATPFRIIKTTINDTTPTIGIGDGVNASSLIVYSSGMLEWGPGTGAARDTSLRRIAAGKLQLAGTTPMLLMGGSSSSFSALKRSTTNIVVRLADDSADTGLEANILKSRLNATSAAAPTIASAATIAPTNSIVFISGTTAIDTITAPAPISATGGQIVLIPTGVFTTTTAGNIALASTAVVSKALIMVYDSGTTKWYPSY